MEIVEIAIGFKPVLFEQESKKYKKDIDRSVVQNMRAIDKITLQAIFNKHTVFSMFFKVDIVFNQIHKQLEEVFLEINKEQMSPD